MIYAFVWSIYIWSYIVYDCRSLYFNSVMLLWSTSTLWSKEGSAKDQSEERETQHGTKRKTEVGILYPPSFLLLIKEIESSFHLFVSKITTHLSGTSSSEWTLDFPITGMKLFDPSWCFQIDYEKNIHESHHQALSADHMAEKISKGNEEHALLKIQRNLVSLASIQHQP